MQDWWHQIAGIPGSLFAAIGGAAMGVAIEFRRHTWGTALLALASGIFVAYFGTDTIVSVLKLPEVAKNAVAALLGISGRNLIAWWLAASKDPISLWDRLRGRK